ILGGYLASVIQKKGTATHCQPAGSEHAIIKKVAELSKFPSQPASRQKGFSASIPLLRVS
ncbi:MAG: hypothetical protein OEL80_08385, partial [Desulfuromonadales bacterium]|nr:hypothetical protein [Desulfuromonadales bacterium]